VVVCSVVQSMGSCLEIACMILLCKILSSTSVVYIVLAIAGNPLLNLFP